MSEVEVLLSGWGSKEGSAFKSWRTRYFVLRNRIPTDKLGGTMEGPKSSTASSPVANATHLLLYFKSPEHAQSETRAPTGYFPIVRDESECVKVTKKGMACLQITTPGTARVFFVIPQNPIESWLEVLTTLVAPSNGAAERRKTLAERPVPVAGAQSSAQDDTMEMQSIIQTGLTMQGMARQGQLGQTQMAQMAQMAQMGQVSQVGQGNMSAAQPDMMQAAATQNLLQMMQLAQSGQLESQMQAYSNGGWKTDDSWKNQARSQLSDMPNIEDIRRRYLDLANEFVNYKCPDQSLNKEKDKLLRSVGGADTIAEALEFPHAAPDAIIESKEGKQLMMNILENVCSTNENWDTQKDATMLTCALFIGYSYDKRITEGLQDVRKLIQVHVARICGVLKETEANLRSGGEWEKLVAIDSPQSPISRQDDSNILGTHPDFVQHKATFTKSPAIQNNDMSNDYLYEFPQQVIELLPEQLQNYVRWEVGMLSSSYKMSPITPPYILEAGISMDMLSHNQPFVMFLLAVASKINPSFQQKVYTVVGSDFYQGTLETNKIKKMSRSMVKCHTDYADASTPTGAQLLDVVRCMVSCPTVSDLLKTYGAIKKEFEILRVKNGFAVEAETDAPLFR